MSFITPVFFILSALYFNFLKKNLFHFFLFGIIFFNFFIFSGYHIYDEILLIVLLSTIALSLYSFELNFKKNIQNIKNYIITNNKIDIKFLVFSILILYFIFTTLIGAYFYDLRIIRFTFLFIFIFLYYLFKDKFFKENLDLDTCVNITKFSIFSLLFFNIQGAYFEITFFNPFSRFESQGNLVAGSSIAFSILLFSTLPAIKIYKYNSKLCIGYLIVALSTVMIFESRMGACLLLAFVLVNFYKKLLLFLFIAFCSLVLNIIFDFTTFYYKYNFYEKHLSKCIDAFPDKLENLDCNIRINKKTPLLLAIDYTLYLNSYHRAFPIIKYKLYEQFRIRNFQLINNYIQNNNINIEGADKIINILKNNNKQEVKNFLLFKNNLNKFNLKNLIETEDTEKANIAILNTDHLKFKYSEYLNENFFINPGLSDIGRRIFILASLDHIKNSNIYHLLFGYGFYSHKKELLNPLKKILSKDTNFIFENEKKFRNFKKSKFIDINYPIRTFNLPALIVDGGFFLFLILLVFYALIGFDILKKFRQQSLFLNQGIIVGSIFLLNYVNFNIDLVFLWIILLHPNHFTKFSFNS